MDIQKAEIERLRAELADVNGCLVLTSALVRRRWAKAHSRASTIRRLTAELAVSEKDHRAMEALRSGIPIQVMEWNDNYKPCSFRSCGANGYEHASDTADAILRAAKGGKGE
jgi:hypothetical protein